MTQEPERAERTPGRGHPTRGFLFADLRGYTAFVERRGAAAAADLVARYRRVVRATVARHDGAEIRTEGDSFYVVFPSISAAVECGVAITRDVSAELGESGQQDVGVGVGIHAGETLETDEGYIGSAVNVAARLCALAGRGEVLVSDTVRVLTQNVLTLPFTPRGRRHLKGVAEPVTIYAVGTASASRARIRLRPASRSAIPAIAVITVLAVAAAAIALRGGNPGTAAVPTDGASSSPSLGSMVSTSSPSRRATTSATAPPAFSERERQLLEHVPPLIRGSCRPGPGVFGRAEVACTLGDTAHVVYIEFDNADAMNADYARRYRPLLDPGVPTLPECNDKPYQRTYAGSAVEQTGLVMCYQEDIRPYVAWTDDALAILTIAASRGPDAVGLFRWWQENRAGPQP